MCVCVCICAMDDFFRNLKDIVKSDSVNGMGCKKIMIILIDFRITVYST